MDDFDPMVVVDLDPLSVGTLPRYVLVSTLSGEQMYGLWTGDPLLAVNDLVSCRKSSNGPYLVIVGVSGTTVYVPGDHTHYQLWESDLGAVAAETDASGNLLINGTRDIYPALDGAGVVERNSAWKQTLPNFTHCNNTRGSGWGTWRSGGYWTQANYSSIGLLSFWRIGQHFGSPANPYLFIPRSTAVSVVGNVDFICSFTFQNVPSGTFFAIRLDDGNTPATRNNPGSGEYAIEWGMHLNASGYIEYILNNISNGTVTTTTYYQIYDHPRLRGIKLTANGTAWSNWGVDAANFNDTPAYQIITSLTGLAWTPTTIGLMMYVNSAAPYATMPTLVDYWASAI